MVSWSNLEKLCSCSRTWMVSALACGNKWIQVGTYNRKGKLRIKTKPLNFCHNKLASLVGFGLGINIGYKVDWLASLYK